MLSKTPTGPTFSLLISVNDQEQRLSLTRQTSWTFGSSRKNDVWLESADVAPFHALLEVVEDRYCHFIDLSSDSGTLINDEPMLKPRHLQHGDRIAIGQILMVFEVSSQPEAPEENAPVQAFILQGQAMQSLIWQHTADRRLVGGKLNLGIHSRRVFQDS